MKASLPLWLFVCLFCSSSLHAQWDRQYPLDNLDDILDIDLSNEGYGFATGPNDMILRYNAAEKSWDLLPGYGTNWQYEAVDYQEGSNGNVAIVGGEKLIQTRFAGNTWVEIPGAPQNINTVKSLSLDHILAIGDNGAFEWENDIWTDLELPVSSGIKGAFILDELHMWVFAHTPNAAIYYTTDGGDNWNTNLDIEDIDVVTFYDALNGVASDGRKIYTTTNGGVNWTLISTNVIHNTSNDIAFGSSKEVLVSATANADPSLSLDGGLTWTKFITGLINNRSYSVAVISDTEFFIGNDLASMAYTNDQGVTWSERSGPVRNVINDIHFVTRSVGFGVGQKGMVLRTYNGGNDWEEYTAGTRNNLAVHGLTPNDLWIGTQQRILHSVDSGDTWTESLIILGANINDVLAVSSQSVLGVSTSGIIYRTVNAGAKWDTVYNAGTQLKSIARMDEQNLMAVGFNGLILRSDDQGATWETVAAPEAGLQYEQISFTEGTGWLVTSSFKKVLWKTDNLGTTWTPVTLPVDRSWEGVYFITPDTGIVVSNAAGEGRAYITYTGGQTWSSSYITSYPFNGVAGFPNPNGTAWIYGYGSDIEVLPNCNSIPGISDFTGDIFPCEADTVTYTVHGENIDNYHWLFPSGWEIIGEGNNDTVRVLIGDNSGNLSVKGSNVCGETNILNFNAGADRLPELFGITGDPLPCVQDILLYTSSGTDIDDFTWTMPSDWQIISGEGTNTIQVFIGSEAGVLQLTGNNQCGTSSIEFPVQPFQVPEVTIIMLDESTLGASVIASEYQWFLNGSEIPGANQSTYTPVENGLYAVGINFLPVECGGISEPIDFVISSLFNPSSKLVHVYPVPVADNLYIENLDGDFEYRVTDLSGRLLSEGKEETSYINVSALPVGVYMLNLVSDGKAYHAKFIKR